MSLLDQLEDAHRKRLNPAGGCHNCPLRTRKPDNYVPATLRPGRVLWLGEGPGATEVEKGEGFTGKSGQRLRSEASEARVPEPWSFSNAVHCRPVDNATPKPREIECCSSQFVLDEIRDYPFVVMVGAVPLRALFPGGNATHFRGNFAVHPDYPGQKFYAIYHPAYTMRRQDMLPDFQRQLERLGRVVRGEPDPQFKLVRGQSLGSVLRDLNSAPLVSFDFETTSVRSWKLGAKIKSMSVTADGKIVGAVHEDEPHFIAALEWMRQYMEQEDKSVVGHNVGFDVEWLERDLDFDSRCGVQELSSIWYELRQYKQVSLKQLVAEQLDGYRCLVHEPHLEKDADILLYYNAEDVVYSLQLFFKGMKELKPAGRDLVTRVSGPMSLITRQMQTTGMYLRQDYRKQKVDEYNDLRRAEVSAWKDEDPDFIPKDHEKGKGLSTYLFDIKKLPVLSLTDNDQPQTDKASVKQWIRDGHSYLKHLLRIKEIDKLLSTYLTAYDKHVWDDSRLHPSHWMTSTDTSRPSSSDPNVYNIPRNREIRDLFGVPRGSRLVESDLSQIEFRIMVCRAHDENGIAGYLRGDDAHTMTARTIAGTPTPTKEQRSEAKPVNFALLYGGTWAVVQAQARDEFGVYWSEEDCRRFTDDFFITYPAIPIFHDNCRTRLVNNRGWFESVTGHVWFYPDWNAENQGRRDHTFRSAINSEGQGPASNICLYIAVQTRRLLNARGFRTVRFINSVYDSIMLEVPNPKWVPDVIATIEDARALAAEWVKSWFVVPLIMEHEVGESWGSLEEFKL